MFYLYKITNTINDKVYIGKTNDPKRRFKEHKSHFEASMPISRAIFKYGKNQFIFEVMLSVETKDEVNFYEKTNIKICRKLGIKLYNILDGGDGGISRTWTEEQKKVVSEKMSGENNPNFGKYFYDRTGIKHTDDSKAKGKITKNIAVEIRSNYASGKFSQQELADKHNVCLTNINRIICNRIWK